MGKHTPAAEQRRLVDLWRATDTSMASFAGAHGIRPGTFSTWVERHPAQPATGAFLQLAVDLGTPRGADEKPRTFGVHVGGHALRFDLPPPPAWFAALLRELAPC